MDDGQGQGQRAQIQIQYLAFQLNETVQELTNLSQALTAQGIPNLIARFNGTRESLFEWLKSTKEHAFIMIKETTNMRWYFFFLD